MLSMLHQNLRGWNDERLDKYFWNGVLWPIVHLDGGMMCRGALISFFFFFHGKLFAIADSGWILLRKRWKHGGKQFVEIDVNLHNRP